MQTLTAYPAGKNQLKALKAFLAAMNIKYQEQESDIYNPEFLAKMKQADEDIKAGLGVKMTVEELRNSL